MFQISRGRLVGTFVATALLSSAMLPAIASTQLTGAGSTFVYPFFSKAFYEYSQQNKDVTVNYQSIGSGGGIQQFTAKTVDFGASDVPMNEAEVTRAGGGVLQIPVALGGVSVVYNLPNVKTLRLSREDIVSIYLGKIAKWNDPTLKKSNPGADLPDLPIIPTNRSDGSGTTYIFTDFLSTVSADWKSKVGTGKSVQWPASGSVGGKGNEGVAGAVKQTPGAVGYVELAYALENKMDQAQVQNKGGKWVVCNASAVRAAAATKPDVSSTNFSIVDSAGAESWPISGYVWAMVYENPSDKARAKTTKDVLSWAVTKGQPIAGTLNYVPLPDNVQASATKTLSQIKL